MPLATVVNLRRKFLDRDTLRIYIGRGSLYGNPFLMRNGSDEERQDVINAYEQYARQVFEPKDLAPLIGKELACYCKPKACHGDVLVKLLDEWEEEIIDARERRNSTSENT